MTSKIRPACLVLAVTCTYLGCGDGRAPTAPSGPQSFLAGTWRGTMTIQVNPGDPGAPPYTVTNVPTRGSRGLSH